MSRKIVYLFRHGLTPGNLEKRYIGQKTDEALLAESRSEAKRVAGEVLKELADNPQKSLRLCSGPMKRATATAAAFADTWSTIAPADFEFSGLRIIGELTEIDFGVFEGKNYEELQEEPLYQAWIDSGGSAPFPGGESRETFIERTYKGFLKALGDPGREETVVIVCHGGNIMAVLNRLTSEDYFSFMTEPLSGYRLELETENEGISALTYRRIAFGNPA